MSEIQIKQAIAGVLIAGRFTSWQEFEGVALGDGVEVESWRGDLRYRLQGASWITGMRLDVSEEQPCYIETAMREAVEEIAEMRRDAPPGFEGATDDLFELQAEQLRARMEARRATRGRQQRSRQRQRQLDVFMPSRERHIEDRSYGG